MIEQFRLRNTHTNLYIILTCILMGLLGVFLLVSLDGYRFNELNDGLLNYSIYTVYTQFGFFIFPVVSILLITEDYKNNNIAFYQVLNIDAVKYFFSKLVTIILYVTIGNFVVAMVDGFVFINLEFAIVLFIKIENVSFYIIIVSMLIAYIFKSLMIAYCINFGIWVLSIIFSTVNNRLSIFCFYDASVSRHISAKIMFEQHIIEPFNIINEVIYNMVVFVLCIIIIAVLKKRWAKYGI